MTRRLSRHFRLQQDQHDCGVTCLRNILAYYRADLSVEKLREWSGASAHGTTLLGLHQAATQAGFTAQGAQAGSVDDLQEVRYPCILPVTINDAVLHYVVYYPEEKTDYLLLGDPAIGLIRMKKQELEKIWTSRAVLLLEPGANLSRWQRQRQKKMSWLGRTLKEDIHLLYTAVIVGILCALLNLSTAVFSQRLVDHILPGRRRQELYIGLLLMGLLLIIKSLLSRARQFLLIRQGYGFNTRLTGNFFKSILYLDKPFFDNRKTGDLIARLNDTLRIQQAMSYILGEMSIQSLVLLATLLLLFIYSWQIGVFCLLMLPVIYGVVKYFEKQIILEQRSVLLAHARNESNYVDTIRGIHTVKVMNKENLFAGIARDIFAAFQGAVWQLGKVRVRFSTVLEITAALFGLTIIAWGASGTLNGSLHIGQLIAILQLSGLLMQTAVQVALTNLQVQEAVVALDRMYEFTMLAPEYDPAIADHDQASCGDQAAGRDPIEFRKLSMQHVGFRHPGRKLLLKDITLEVEKGEIIAIAGESGQGKSTLLQLLQKFYPGEGGPILINDVDLKNIDTMTWRKLIGVVPQEIAIFSGSLLANICLDHSPEHVDKVPQFCKKFGFDRWFEAFPQGYATILGEGGVALSGGQKQLLALARCLYANPQLILLDEPTAAMDAATEQFVIDVLLQFKEQAAMLIISHKDSLTGMADRLYLLDKGITSPVQRKNYDPIGLSSFHEMATLFLTLVPSEQHPPYHRGRRTTSY